MLTFEHTVTDMNGIHARPAGMLVKTARGYTSEVTITVGERTADAKKILSVMELAVKCGEVIIFTVSGDDERIAVNGLSEFCGKYL